MSDPTKPNPIRRRVLAAGGAAGAVAAAAAAVPLVRPADVPVADAAKDETDPHRSAGYRETAHVLRYYQTTRV